MLGRVFRRTAANSGSITASRTLWTSQIEAAAASSSVSPDGRRHRVFSHVMTPYVDNHQSMNTNLSNNNSRRWFSSRYIMVDHSSAYQDAMISSHGVQLQLALEEGRGKDDAPFDPFSQFLDGMGSTVDGDFEDDDEIEEAEYTDLQSKSDDDVDDDDDDEVDEGGPIYTTTGALYRPKSERLALRAGYPAGGTFAVIHLAGFQHKITIDDLLVVNKLKPASSWSVGSTHTLKDQEVLLMANQDMTLVGLPGVMGGEVDVMVEEITRDKTVVVFKKRRRKNSRRKNGFRREVTFLRVLDVRMPKEIAKIIQHKREDGSDVAA